MKEFIFTMHWPTRRPASASAEQTFSITSKYPQMFYRVLLEDDERLSTEAQQRLAISELKVRLIAEIASAEFEVETT